MTNDEKIHGASLAADVTARSASDSDAAPHVEEDYSVPIEEAIRRIGRKKHIHTFLSTAFTLLGADHDRDELIEKMRTLGVENSGAQATAMGHTLVIRKYHPSPLFIEAKPAKAEWRG